MSDVKRYESKVLKMIGAFVTFSYNWIYDRREERWVCLIMNNLLKELSVKQALI